MYKHAVYQLLKIYMLYEIYAYLLWQKIHWSKFKLNQNQLIPLWQKLSYLQPAREALSGLEVVFVFPKEWQLKWEALRLNYSKKKKNSYFLKSFFHTDSQIDH